MHLVSFHLFYCVLLWPNSNIEAEMLDIKTDWGVSPSCVTLRLETHKCQIFPPNDRSLPVGKWATFI